MEKKKIIVQGSIIYDCFVWGPRFPEVGEAVIGYRNGFFSGGKGANQAVQCSKLGAETIMLGCVGNDPSGMFLINALKGYGVNTDHVAVLDQSSTSSCCIHVDANGDNKIMLAPLANLDFSKAQIDEAMPVIRGAKVYVTQLETNLEAAFYGLKKAKESGIITILNPAPPADMPEGMMKYADYVTPNETECKHFTGIYPEAGDPASCREAVARLRELGASNVVLTLGKNGAYYDINGQSGLVPAYSIKAVDATGAGDAFNGALAVALAEGRDPVASLRFACAAGAVAAMGSGAQPAMGTAEDLQKLMDEQNF